MGKTRKVGTTGRFGVRYGRKIRLRVRAVEGVQKQKQTCPCCGFARVKRRAAGLYSCGKCGAEFAGGAYSASTLTGALIRKMVAQKRFAPYVEELAKVTGAAKGVAAEEHAPGGEAEAEAQPEIVSAPKEALAAPGEKPKEAPAEKPRERRPEEKPGGKREEVKKEKKPGGEKPKEKKQEEVKKEKKPKEKAKEAPKAEPAKGPAKKPKKERKKEAGIGAKLKGFLKRK